MKYKKLRTSIGVNGYQVSLYYLLSVVTLGSQFLIMASMDIADRLNYYSEKFESRLFLSRVHCDTSAADLEAGALALKNDLQGRTQAKKQLVKENFDCFVSCKTTIDGEYFALSEFIFICIQSLDDNQTNFADNRY